MNLKFSSSMPDKNATNSDGESATGSDNEEEMVNQELENLKEDSQVC